MRRLRLIWGHRKPFSAHLKSNARFWPVLACATAAVLALLALFLGDPAWVPLAACAALYGYAVTFAVLGIASYRRSLNGQPPDRSQTHTRNDIWKDRWPM